MILCTEAFGIPDTVAKHAQWPLGTKPWVKQSHAAGGDISRVGKWRFPTLLLPLIQTDEVAISHVDFAAQFQNMWESRDRSVAAARRRSSAHCA